MRGGPKPDVQRPLYVVAAVFSLTRCIFKSVVALNELKVFMVRGYFCCRRFDVELTRRSNTG
jgi:hypothetical protein